MMMECEGGKRALNTAARKPEFECQLCQWLSSEESIYNGGDLRDVGLIPGWGRFPGGGNGYPLQYSCLGNPRDRGVWWATVHGVSRV